MTDKKEINHGGSAFPCEGGNDSGLHPDAGMSKRDYFAGKALPNIMDQVARKDNRELAEWMSILGIPAFENREDFVAYLSYRVADAMVAASECRHD